MLSLSNTTELAIKFVLAARAAGHSNLPAALEDAYEKANRHNPFPHRDVCSWGSDDQWMEPLIIPLDPVFGITARWSPKEGWQQPWFISIGDVRPEVACAYCAGCVGPCPNRVHRSAPCLDKLLADAESLRRASEAALLLALGRQEEGSPLSCLPGDVHGLLLAALAN